MTPDTTLDLLLVDDEESPFPKGRSGGVSDFDSAEALIGAALRWLMGPPKLAIPLLSAQAKAAGHSVASIYRPSLPWKQEKFRRLLRRQPRVVAITTVAIFDPAFLRLLTREVRKLSPGSLIVLGGHGAADSPAIRALGDLYISGHGEWALASLLTALKNGVELNRVPGVSDVPGTGLSLAGSLRYEGIGRVLFPDWGATSSGCRRYPVEASRGCRFNCSYCAFPGKTSQVFREVADVVEEMRLAREQRGIRRFEFVDSSLTSNPEFVLGLCAALRKEKFRPDWKCFARPDSFANVPELADRMAEAGCSAIFMGIESIHDDILSRMRRGMGRATVELGLARAFKAGIKVHGNFIIGFPGETEATVMDTAEFIASRPFSSVYLCTFGMSPEMRDLAAADPKRYANLRGEPIKGWRHDGMDYRKAYELTVRAIHKINWRKLWPVAATPTTSHPDCPPF